MTAFNDPHPASNHGQQEASRPRQKECSQERVKLEGAKGIREEIRQESVRSPDRRRHPERAAGTRAVFQGDAEAGLLTALHHRREEPKVMRVFRVFAVTLSLVAPRFATAQQPAAAAPTAPPAQQAPRIPRAAASTRASV